MAISLNPATLLNGNGIDVTALVAQVQAQKSGQLDVWKQQQTDLQSQSSALGVLNTDLANLKTTIDALKDPLGAFAAMSATSSLPAILTATAQTNATAGNHTIVVSELASAGTLYTDAVSGGASVSILPTGATSGEIQLQVGGTGGATHAIHITKGSNDTLNTLVTYINQQSTKSAWGVTATVLNDASGSRLAIYSQNTGTSGALAITSNTTSDAGGNIIPGTPTNLGFKDPIGENATFTVDGIPFSSTSNTVADAIPGVTLSLVSAEPGVPLQLSIGKDVAQATTAINAFVVAYNTLMTAINHQFAVDPNTGLQGPLGSDGSLRALQSRLLADVSYSIKDNSGLISLATLGVDMNDDGTLTVGTAADGRKLSQILTDNPTAVQNLFQGSKGWANNFGTDLLSLTSPTVGILNLDLGQNNRQQAILTDSISNFEDQLATQKQDLIARFSQVNAVLESYPYVLAMITAQLGSILPTTSTTTTTGTSTSSTG
jgi:flagellar hook-associated protein 2